LKCCSILKTSFARFNASQLNNWHSVFQTAKKVLVTSFKILDIPRCALRWASQSLTVDHRHERKAISSELLASLQAEGETFQSQTVTAGDTQVHHFAQETKAQSMERHHPQAPRRTNSKSLHQGPRL
jgi:hypothetical protein